eukprot:TRINITY_DN3859_c0_g2_i1.p1 TRINITY_DN3859_c0_g2~~TRINITY_DN3859_c0_g2_i1.p1  ORF type:complete len:771 (-),score=140.76 TRINITY_DN3859_c0_g2_i1:1121-3289(-)
MNSRRRMREEELASRGFTEPISIPHSHASSGSGSAAALAAEDDPFGYHGVSPDPTPPSGAAIVFPTRRSSHIRVNDLSTARIAAIPSPRAIAPPTAEVILSDAAQGKVVVYSDSSKSLVVCDVKDASPRRTFRAPANARTATDRCPLCHNFVSAGDFAPSMNTGSFMHPQYFNTLAGIHEADPATSAASEHHRRESFQYPVDEHDDQSSGKVPEEGASPNSSFITGYYQRFFTEVKKLGTGSFGSVFLCQHVLHGVDLGTYAVKKIVLSDDPNWQKRVFREVRLLERVHHPNIIAYRHTWLEFAKIADFGPLSPCLFLLMEYANGGNLDDYIEMANQYPLDESDIWKVFVDILQGLRHLHHAGVVHRDIKPANILLSHEFDSLSRAEYRRVLISDFGQCESMLRNQRLPRTGFTGTMLYAAPELLHKDGEFDHSCDIYSLGILVYALCYGQAPYQHLEHLSHHELYQKIMEDGRIPIPEFPRRSRDMVDLIHYLTNPNPRKRPSADDILSDPRFLMRLSREQHFESFESPRHRSSFVRTEEVPQARIGSKGGVSGIPLLESRLRPNPALRMPEANALVPARLPQPVDSPPAPSLPSNAASQPIKIQDWMNDTTKSAAYVLAAVLKIWLVESSCDGEQTPAALELYPCVVLAMLPPFLTLFREWINPATKPDVRDAVVLTVLAFLSLFWTVISRIAGFCCTITNKLWPHLLLFVLQVMLAKRQ